MSRTFIVYYDFKNTSGNHSGMAHLVRLLRNDSGLVVTIKNIRHEFKLGKYLSMGAALCLGFYLAFVLRKNDKVFFFEYLIKGTAHQSITAKVLRVLGVKNQLFGLVHLSGSHLMELYGSERAILDDLKPINRVFVFGSSLLIYLKGIGFAGDISRTFHYVDTDYYRPGILPSNSQLQVVSIGSLKRNYEILKKVILMCPGVTFHICMGMKDLSSYFGDVPNVKLYSFLLESELLHLMQKCDVGISVMDDTIGSNVITTSMAVGLVQVVSDVGSIRDYCDNKTSFICRTEKDFSMAITDLDNDRSKLNEMKQHAIAASSRFSHRSFINEFQRIIQK